MLFVIFYPKKNQKLFVNHRGIWYFLINNSKKKEISYDKGQHNFYWIHLLDFIFYNVHTILRVGESRFNKSATLVSVNFKILYQANFQGSFEHKKGRENDFTTERMISKLREVKYTYYFWHHIFSITENLHNLLTRTDCSICCTNLLSPEPFT